MDLDDSDATKLQIIQKLLILEIIIELVKNTRALNHNEKHAGITNQISTMAGGSGPAVTGLLIPYEKTMGTSTFDAGSLQGLREITLVVDQSDLMILTKMTAERAIKIFVELYKSNGRI